MYIDQTPRARSIDVRYIVIQQDFLERLAVGIPTGTSSFLQETSIAPSFHMPAPLSTTLHPPCPIPLFAAAIEHQQSLFYHYSELSIKKTTSFSQKEFRRRFDGAGITEAAGVLYGAGARQQARRSWRQVPSHYRAGFGPVLEVRHKLHICSYCISRAYITIIRDF